MGTLEQELTYETKSDSCLASERYNTTVLENQARYLIANHHLVEHDHWQKEPEINARTALFEELTAKGHLSRVEYATDVDTANRQTLTRLLNGWSDSLPWWEKERRFREIVEELVIHEVWADVKAGLLPSDIEVLTLSDYEDKAPPNEAHKIGYRFLNLKGYVRGTHFEISADGQWHRVVEQISRSNSNDYSSGQFLVSEAGSTADISGSTQRLAQQVLISRSNFPGGVIDIQRKLDSYVGPNIRYGEDATKSWPPLPDYDELRQISTQREARLQSYTSQLAEFERQINVQYHSEQITYDQKLGLICQKRKNLVDEICLLEPGYASDARGELSGKYFAKAAIAMASGDHSGGTAYLKSALKSADPRASAVCGGDGVSRAAAMAEAVRQKTKTIYNNALEERKNWKWTKGYCVVGGGCKNRSRYVEVGPCSVCRSCQDVFDGKKIAPKQLDIFEIISNWFKKEKQKHQIKKAAENQAKAELGDNVTHLDVKRYEKQLCPKLAD